MAGSAAVHTLAGELAFTGAVKENHLLVGAEIADEFDVAELRNGANQIVGLNSSARRRRATFTIIPYDAAGSLVTAKGNVKIPAPLARVTITGSGVDELDGDWNYMGGGQLSFSTDGYARLTLPCAQFGDTPAAL